MTAAQLHLFGQLTIADCAAAAEDDSAAAPRTAAIVRAHAAAAVAGRAAVEEWSLRIHGPSCDRHRWALAAADAHTAGRPMPDYPRARFHGLTETRQNTARRIYAGAYARAYGPALRAAERGQAAAAAAAADPQAVMF